MASIPAPGGFNCSLFDLWLPSSASTIGAVKEQELSEYGQGQKASFLLDWFAVDQRIGLLLSRELPRHGLRGDEYGVYSLMLLYGPLSPTELADMAGMPLTTLSDFLQRARERGHITATSNPKDGRSYLVALSNPGKAAHAKVRPAFQRILDLIRANLDIDVDLIREVVANVDKAVRIATDEIDSQNG